MNHESENLPESDAPKEDACRIIGDRVMRVTIIEPEDPDVMRRRDRVRGERTGGKPRTSTKIAGGFIRPKLSSDLGSIFYE